MKGVFFFIVIVIVSYAIFVQMSSTGMVSITFDDGNISEYTNGFRILNQLHIPATIGVISARIGVSGFLSGQQVCELRDSGWEIASHGVNHLAMTSLDSSAARAELSKSKQAIDEVLGGNYVHNFIAPFTAWNRDLDKLAAGIYSSVCIGRNRSNPIPPPYRLNRYVVYTKTPVDQLINIVESEAIKHKRWVILMFHAVGESDEFGWEPFPNEKLNAFGQWLQGQKIPVVTIQEGLRQKGLHRFLPTRRQTA